MIVWVASQNWQGLFMIAKDLKDVGVLLKQRAEMVKCQDSLKGHVVEDTYFPKVVCWRRDGGRWRRKMLSIMPNRLGRDRQMGLPEGKWNDILGRTGPTKRNGSLLLSLYSLPEFIT